MELNAYLESLGFARIKDRDEWVNLLDGQVILYRRGIWYWAMVSQSLVQCWQPLKFKTFKVMMKGAT